MSTTQIKRLIVNLRLDHYLNNFFLIMEEIINKTTGREYRMYSEDIINNVVVTLIGVRDQTLH